MATAQPAAMAPWSARSLAEHAIDRNNNFNLIRVTLAAMVLVHHAHVLTGHSIAPLSLATRFMSRLGEIGVGGFFIVSGFLVTQSLLARATVTKFAIARVLRIYPGLIVMLFVTTGALAAMSALPPGVYFTSPQLWEYLGGNATAVLTEFYLPGVFAQNPDAAVNGSLWSLRYEMLCYLALAFAGLLGLARMRWPFLVVVASLGIAFAAIYDRVPQLYALLIQTGYLFGIGAAAAAYADRIPLRFAYAAALFAAALLLDMTWLHYPAWGIAYAYLLLWVAYGIKGRILNFNRLPDVSYGLYIYAFPIQQTMIALGLGVGVASNILWSAPAALLCATVSWYVVEKPCLELKNALGRRKDRRAPAS